MGEIHQFRIGGGDQFLDSSSWIQEKGNHLNKINRQSEGENETDSNSVQSSEFSQTLKTAFNKVNELQKEADQKIQAFSTGKNKNIPEVMISLEKAEVAMKLTMRVRNKIIEAYQEVMRMQI